MNSRELYNHLYFNKGASVSIELDLLSYQSLRRSLSRKHETLRSIGASALSLVTTFQDGTATFTLALRKTKDYDVYIEEEINGEKIRTRLE